MTSLLLLLLLLLTRTLHRLTPRLYTARSRASLRNRGISEDHHHHHHHQTLLKASSKHGRRAPAACGLGIPMSCMAVSIHVTWGHHPHVIHGGVHPRHMGVPSPWPRVAREGACKQQLLDHEIIRPTSCAPQPPDSVPPQEVSHAGLASGGQQLSSRGAIYEISIK